jgi:hypothetical protein
MVSSLNAMYEPLPAEPGKSGRNLKGLAYRNIFKFVTAHVPGGLDAVAGRLTSPGLRAFCLQPFMSASWYDALPVLPITAAIAASLGMPLRAYLREGGKKQAKFDYANVHKSLVASQHPGEAVERHIRIGLRYYDFLTAHGDPAGGTTARFYVQRMPSYLVAWFLPMQEAYSAEILCLSGANKATVSATTSAPVDPMSLKPVELTFEARWEM